jgi:hypothetical protein
LAPEIQLNTHKDIFNFDVPKLVSILVGKTGCGEGVLRKAGPIQFSLSQIPLVYPDPQLTQDVCK